MEDSGTLTVFVNIPYIRSKLKPLGDSFILKLGGVKNIGFVDFDGISKPFMEEIDLAQIEILSTDSVEMPVTVATTVGMLKLDFENLSIYLDTGGEIQFQAVLKACDEYWENWKTKR